MAAKRPAVLVFQEFANPAITPATPELNCLIAGPCYQIMDYPDDKANTQVTNYGAAGAAAPYAPPVTPGGDTLYATPPAMVAGAALDATSIRVYLENAAMKIVADGDNAGGVVTTATLTALGVLTITAGSFVAAGVLAGDTCYVTDGGGHTIKRTVRTVTALSTTFKDEIPLAGETFVVGAGLHFYIVRAAPDQQVPSAKVTVAGNSVTLKGGLVDAGSGKPITSANVFMSYRALRTDLAKVQSVTADSVTSILGKFDARNPLCIGARIALQNTASPIEVYGVTSDDLAGYTSMRDGISSHPEVYAVVPMSTNKSVIQMLSTFVTQASDPDFALQQGIPQRFRTVICSVGTLPTESVVSGPGVSAATSGGTGVIVDTVATFIDAGVIVGDFVETSVLGDYSDAVQYPITAVTSNQRLTAAALPDGVTAYRIARALTKDGQVVALQAVTASIASRRVVACWPDSVVITGLVDGSLPRAVAALAMPAGPQSGAYLAAAVGGMTASLPSHQGFTGVAVAGFDTLNHANTYFSEAQLSAISNGGWFVFAQPVPAALPTVLHQLTTDVSTLEFSEFSMVKNFDYVSLFLAGILADFPGKWNINEETVSFVRASLDNGLDELKLDKRPRIGARINSGTISSLAQSTVSADRLECFVEAKFPAPLNTVALHIVSQ